jgi:hypothetical protein
VLVVDFIVVLAIVLCSMTLGSFRAFNNKFEKKYGLLVEGLVVGV